MAITSYTVPPSFGENTTSSMPVSVQYRAEYPVAGMAASSVAELVPTVSTAVPPTVEYRCSAPVGELWPGAGSDFAAGEDVVAAGDEPRPTADALEPAVPEPAVALGVAEGVAIGTASGAAVEPTFCAGQAATCGPSVAVGSTESSPAQTTAIAVAVAAPQARAAYNARFGTLAALLPDPARRHGGPVPVHWLSAVNPLGCHIMARVLLVEDDPDIRSTVIRQLSEFGHSVRSAGTALAALREATRDPGDVIVLDLGLPDLDGSEALKMLRAVTRTPVIIATARDDEAEIIRLLHAGADDYLVKPYSAAHLAARIAAVLRRSGAGAAPSVLKVGGLEIDPRRRQAQLDGQRLDLSRREFDLLAYLAARPGEVVTRRELLSEVWQLPYGDDQTIDVHLSWLRRKLGERASRPRYLHTVRGVGVRLVEPAGNEPAP